jgi:SAM-dependent methyltransferase
MKLLIKKIIEKLNLSHYIIVPYAQFAFWRDYGRKYASLKGGSLFCNVCNNSFQKFVPFLPIPDDRNALEKYNVIAGYGDNVICPKCMSSSRERLVYAMLQNEIKYKNKKILQLAPERAIYNLLKSKAAVITTDFTPSRYKHIDRKIQFADITNLPFQSEHFDIVIANHIMEHIPDDTKAMQEIFRVLKQNGQAILQIPYSTVLPKTIEDLYINDPVKQSKLFGQVDHVRIYSLNDYVKKLINTGFRVKVLQPIEFEKYQKFTLQPNEVFLEITK